MDDDNLPWQNPNHYVSKRERQYLTILTLKKTVDNLNRKGRVRGSFMDYDERIIKERTNKEWKEFQEEMLEKIEAKMEANVFKPSNPNKTAQQVAKFKIIQEQLKEIEAKYKQTS